jgi:hypothetical protein
MKKLLCALMLALTLTSLAGCPVIVIPPSPHQR